MPSVHIGLLFLSSAKGWRELYALSCMLAVGIAYGMQAHCRAILFLI